MHYYFTLQYKRLTRWLKEMGVPPFVGIVGGLLAFIAGSLYVFYKLEVAEWVYAGIGLMVISQLSGAGRNTELRRMCKGLEYRKWRLIENVGGILPFVIYLGYEREWGVALLLLSLAIAISFVTFRQVLFKSIPTPFKKLPFEGIVGFRKTFFVFFIMLFVVVKAIQVDNFNLGLAMLGATYLVQMSYYMVVENDYFVWIYSLDRKSFLKKKWKASQVVALCISLPFAIVLSVFFIEKLAFILGVIVIGHLWVSTAVFAKYASFPKEMNVVQVFIFAGAIILFPFLIFLIPFYIKKSFAKLELYLT